MEKKIYNTAFEAAFDKAVAIFGHKRLADAIVSSDEAWEDGTLGRSMEHAVRLPDGIQDLETGIKADWNKND